MVLRLMSAKHISGLAGCDSKRMSVTVTETLADALERMATFELEDIAVLDEDGRIVNDLRLSEVLSLPYASNAVMKQIHPNSLCHSHCTIQRPLSSSWRRLALSSC